MESHVRILAIIRIVLGALGLVGALVILLVFGGAAGIVGTLGVAEDPEAIMAVPIIGIIGTLIIGLLLVISLPSLIAGIGLLNYRPWARILTIVLSVLDLLNVPFGTAAGVYGLWVLLSHETEPLFRQPQRPVQQWRQPAA
jgi:hypothetical protein